MADLPHFARFWMVCRKPTGANSKTEPRQRYSSRADAIEAAAGLARQNDAAFLVLETVEIIRPRDTTQESLL